MIYIVEWPEGADPRGWFAFDVADLSRKVCEGDRLQPWEVWDRTCARELLELFDETPHAPGVGERYPALFALGQAEGWDTPLYRADHLLEAGTYRPEPVSLYDACVAALHARPGAVRIYADEPVALAAADAPDALFDEQPGGWRARWALREQLIATEALADGH